MIKSVYEDDYLLVVDKPSGLLTVPTPKKEKNTLTNILNTPAVGTSQAMFTPRGREKVYPCHRLDRDTSGLIIYAKSRKIQKLMMNQFRRHQIKKEYIAFVQGKVRKTAGRIKSYITHSRQKPAKLAITNYKVVRYFKGPGLRKNAGLAPAKTGGFTQVLVRPETGRTNQIRLHFRQLGHPILGERRFAFGKDFEIKFKRLALHASRIKFNHPVNNKCLRLYSQLPSDLSRLIAIPR